MLSAVSGEGRLGGRPQIRLWSRLFARRAGQTGGAPKGDISSCSGAGEVQSVSLNDGRLFVTEVVDQCRIDCVAGMAWVTFQDRRCDYILGTGESLVLRKKGKVIISGGGRRDVVVEVACG